MLKRFSKYVFQSVAGMIGVSVYVLADTFFISVYAGADGLAVLNLILPVYGLIYAIGSMIGIGSATRYGISKAKGERADYYFTQAIAWSVLISIPFVLLGIFIPDKCLALLGADAGLVALGKTYLRIILIGTPFFMSNYSVTAFAEMTMQHQSQWPDLLPAVSGISFLTIFLFFRQVLDLPERHLQQRSVRSLRCPSACCIILEKNVTSDSNGRKCLSDI